MKIQDVIDKFEQLKSKHGNVDVHVCWNDGEGGVQSIEDSMFYADGKCIVIIIE